MTYGSANQWRNSVRLGGAHCAIAQRESIRHKPEQLMRDSSAYLHALRFGLIQEIGAPVVFFFERLSQEQQEGLCDDLFNQ